MTKKDLSVLSLFSGGGFLDLGFMEQGFKIKESIEINERFLNAYNYALKKYIVKGFCNKIENPLDASDPIIQSKLQEIHEGITGIIGGPPCQDYSVGGKNAGSNGEKGKLIYSYLKIIELVQPKFLFFENVEGLFRNAEHNKAFNDLQNKLKLAGYFIWADILNPLNYGFPQDRPRIALVGFRIDIVNLLIDNGYDPSTDNYVLKNNKGKFVFNWPKTVIKDPKKICWPKRCDFGTKILEGEEINLIKEKYYKLCVLNAFEGLNDATPNHNDRFNPKSWRFHTIEEGDTNRKSFKRLHRYRYSPTVAYGNNEVHLHPTEPRRLSVREALRLQTVSDDYVLPPELFLSDKFKIISNGVPPKKAELIARQIKQTLNNYHKLIE